MAQGEMSFVRLPVKKADKRCSCVTGQYECGFCRGPRLRRIWASMTDQERDYDRYVAHAPLDDESGERGCSCHLRAPCNFCTDQSEES